jgi:ABC-type lipoprotein release transport system permease subunit
VTLAGTVLGIVVGLGLTHWLNAILDAIHSDRLPVFDLSYFAFRRSDAGRPQRIAWYVFGTVVCGTLFTLLPSLYAARLVPVEALRDE